MVAINSMPQQEVAKGSGHNECERAKPIALSKEVAKKPFPSMPGGASTILISLMLINKNACPNIIRTSSKFTIFSRNWRLSTSFRNNLNN